MSLSLVIRAQNVTIKGKAHVSYAGKVIQLQTYTDFVTRLQRTETSDTIAKDGYFELSFYSEYTQPVSLKIGNVTGSLYVQPDFVYGVTIPELDENFDRKNDADLFVNIGIVGADSTELNILTFDYQEMYNRTFDAANDRFFTKAAMHKKADSLRIKCDKKYKSVKNRYFRSYYEYSIASVNASLSRGENYLIGSYILNKPIQYNHFEYMQFFNTCFSGYLNAVASMKKGQSLYNIINVKANYDLLNNFLKDDKFLKNDSLRELVIIKNLWDFHYSSEFSPEAVETILSDMQFRTKNDQHKKILSTMMAYFNKMQPGSQAPDFSALTKSGTVTSLGGLKNRWIYLNFFSTENVESMKEMAKIASLRKKFGDKLTFVSVCVDDSLSSYINYLRQNPKYDWSIWYNYDKSFSTTAKQNYFVTGTEAYFLISNKGYLALSPAPSPSQGIEYRFNVLFKPAGRTTKTGIR